MRIYGKEELRERLYKTAEQNRLPHAVMFAGKRGSGRKVMARYTAQLFLCGKLACGECAECRNIEHDGHPDVIFVKAASGGKYAMEPLREILRGTVIKPNNGDIKVYVFEDADTMLPQHQNTLLKLIEEPAPHLRFIFTCENTNLIPITVMSRVTKFDVPEAGIEDCVRCLTDGGAEPRKARELAEMFSGNIGACIEALGGDDETRYAETAAKAAKALARRDGYGTAAALSELSGRADMPRVFDCLTQILRDALAVKNGLEAEYSEKQTAREIAANYGGDELIQLISAAFEINANEIYNISTALSAAYFTSTFAR